MSNNRYSKRSRATILLFAIFQWSSVFRTAEAFSLTNQFRNDRHYRRWALPPTDKETRVTTTIENSWDSDFVGDDEKPAGIVGSQFFGGDKRKEEYFDPEAEREAALLERQMAAVSTYDRFADRTAFTDDKVAGVAQSLQRQLNQVLRQSEPTSPLNADSSPIEYPYASSIQWTTPLPSQTKNPLTELETARKFYRQAHVAIISGSPTTNNRENAFEFRWEISLQWPAIWEPRVVLTGSSVVTIAPADKTIVSQVDTLDAELLPTIQAQIFPRFWDLYHIGMTPAAESLPPLPATNTVGGGLLTSVWPLRSYTLQEYPPRLVSQATQWDLGARDDCNAATIPNHAFSCVISTMGPTKQRFTPVTGVQVQLRSQQQGVGGGASRQLELQWQIPLATEYASNEVLVVPGVDPEIDPVSAASCRYVLCPKRRVAIVPYGGYPQDSNISELREKLYKQVVRDGLKPRLDESGRPIFFFTMNSIKACFSEEGLGMAVYEWRPEFLNPNNVGIELEL